MRNNNTVIKGLIKQFGKTLQPFYWMKQTGKLFKRSFHLGYGRNHGKNFVDFFWRFEDTKRTFWNYLTFRNSNSLNKKFMNSKLPNWPNIKSCCINIAHHATYMQWLCVQSRICDPKGEKRKKLQTINFQAEWICCSICIKAN